MSSTSKISIHADGDIRGSRPLPKFRPHKRPRTSAPAGATTSNKKTATKDLSSDVQAALQAFTVMKDRQAQDRQNAYAAQSRLGGQVAVADSSEPIDPNAMYYGTVKYCDIANGPGVRTSLFVSGCRIGCKGCFNQASWDFHFGAPFTQKVADDIIESLKPSYMEGLTILGGEPFEPENQRHLVEFIERFRKTYASEKTLWMYSGKYLYQLLDPEHPYHTEVTERILDCVDVLVDGPFELDKRDISLKFRGSRNQRTLYVQPTRKKGEVVWWREDPVYSQLDR